jgi:hypothetical protein
MKGLEYNQILGMIVLIVVIIIIILIVVNPSLNFGKTTGKLISFEEFCVFWSLNGYAERLHGDVTRNNIDYYTTEENCAPHFNKLSNMMTESDIDACRRCCRKEIAC